MKLAIQTQILVNPEDSIKLKATVERFNEAASWLAGVAFERKLSNRFALQKICYREIRNRFGLPADMAIRCIARVCNSYQRDKNKKPRFRNHASVPYSMGKNIGFKGTDRVSISTLNGRVVVPFVMGKHQVERFGFAKGQCELIVRKDGKWFLLVTVDVPEETKSPAVDFIGVDFGIENIAVDSDGTIHSGKDVEAKRFAYAARRRALGRKSKGAPRKQRRRLHKAAQCGQQKESRFRRNVNHVISKELVAKAKGTGRGIALEDLSGIRDRKQFRKPQRFRMGGWAYYQLKQFIAYKAAIAGVEVVAVDPRNTSRTCSDCGHCDKSNRRSQSDFLCKSCGHREHADLNAARNIRARAAVNPPQGPEGRLAD